MTLKKMCAMWLSACTAVLFMIGRVQSQQKGTIVKSVYTDSVCATVPTNETHTQGMCSKLTVPGQMFTTTAACNSTHATLFVYNDGDCSKTVSPQTYPLNTCVSDGLTFARVTCYPYPEDKPIIQMLYADPNCTKSYGSIWIPEWNCLSNFNPPNQRMVCKSGESYAYFSDVTASDCSGTGTQEYVNPCTAPRPGLGGPGIYTRYTCPTPTTTSFSAATSLSMYLSSGGHMLSSVSVILTLLSTLVSP